MKTILATLFSLMSFFAISQTNDQFRLVGSGTWSTINDSTYQASLSFMSDLSGGGFLATDIVDSFRLFTGIEKIYRVDTVWNKTFSSASVRVVEYNGTSGIPSGQVMIYNPDGRSTIPQVPFGSTGATAQLQAAVVTYNGKQTATGSGITDGDKGGIDVLASGATWAVDTFAVGTIQIAGDAVTASQIAADAVGSSEIAANAVGSSEIAADAVGNSEMADNAVGSAEIIAESIQASDIDTGAVTTSEILDATIALADMGSNSVDSTKIATGGIGITDASAALITHIRQPGIDSTTAHRTDINNLQTLSGRPDGSTHLGTMSQGTQYPDNLSVKTFADSTDAKLTRIGTGSGATINPNDNYLPKRTSSTTFGNSVIQDVLGKVTVTPADSVAGNEYVFINAATKTTPIPDDQFAFRSNYVINHSAVNYHLAAILGNTIIPSTNALNSTQYIAGVYGYVRHDGSGLLSDVYGVNGVVNINGTGNISEANAFKSSMNQQSSTGRFLVARSYYAPVMLNSSGATKPRRYVGFEAESYGVDGVLADSVYAFRSIGDTKSAFGPVKVFGQLNVTNSIISEGTNQATSTTSGDVQTAGGIGIAKNAWVGGILNLGTTGSTLSTNGISWGGSATEGISRTSTGVFKWGGGGSLNLDMDLKPVTNSSYDIGSNTLRFRNAYINVLVSSPQVIGGSAVSSSLTLQSTSGIGTSDFIDFKTGNNGVIQAGRILSNGAWGIGTQTPDASALMDFTSTTKGFLAPRMTTTQRNAISSPATGLQVFQTTTNKPSWFNGSSWRVPVDSVTADATYLKHGANTLISNTTFNGTFDWKLGNTTRLDTIQHRGAKLLFDATNGSEYTGDIDLNSYDLTEADSISGTNGVTITSTSGGTPAVLSGSFHSLPTVRAINGSGNAGIILENTPDDNHSYMLSRMSDGNLMLSRSDDQPYSSDNDTIFLYNQSTGEIDFVVNEILLNGNALGGTAADDLGDHNATDTLDMNLYPIVAARKINGDDVFITASDSVKIESAGPDLQLVSGFARIVDSGGTVRYQLNNSTGSQSLTLPDNTATASNITISGGADMLLFNTTNGAEKLTVGSGTSGSTVQISADTLKFNTGAISDGTWTPTLTNTLNVGASTAYACNYMRVGNTVTVSGRVDIDAVATGSVILEMSLPIASNFTAFENAGGTGASTINTATPIYASAANDRLLFVYTATVATNEPFHFSATYRIQ